MSVEAVAGARVMLQEVLPVLHEWLLRTRATAETRDCVVACLVRQRTHLCCRVTAATHAAASLGPRQATLCRRGFLGPALGVRFLLPPVLRRLSRDDLPLPSGEAIAASAEAPGSTSFNARAAVALCRRVGAAALATVVVPQLLSVLSEAVELPGNPVESWPFEHPVPEDGDATGPNSGADAAGNSGGNGAAKGPDGGVGGDKKPRRATVAVGAARAMADLTAHATGTSQTRPRQHSAHTRSSLHPSSSAAPHFQRAVRVAVAHVDAEHVTLGQRAAQAQSLRVRLLPRLQHSACPHRFPGDVCHCGRWLSESALCLSNCRRACRAQSYQSACQSARRDGRPGGGGGAP